MSKDFEQVKYRKLNQTTDGKCIDEQFYERKAKIPWKAFSLAIILFTVGTTLLIFGIIILTGFADDQYSDRMWPFLLLGLIMFLPGAYHVRIAYYAFMGRRGYSYDDIPEFN